MGFLSSGPSAEEQKLQKQLSTQQKQLEEEKKAEQRRLEKQRGAVLRRQFSSVGGPLPGLVGEDSPSLLG